MSRFKKNETPVSVILRTDQAEWLKKDALKNERTYSQHIRFIVAGYIEYNSKKEKRSGKESEKGQEVGQKGQEVGS